ncbi:hypothetical protein ACLB2K_046130 [Fragaria x ananassa]
MAVSMSASTVSMMARLISKLSHSNQDEPVDLGNMRCSKKGFVVLRYYLIDKLSIARAVTFDSFRSAVRSMWRLSAYVEVQELPSPVAPPSITPHVAPLLVFRDNTHIPIAATPPIPKDKRTVTIREVPTFPSLTKITRFHREWEDDEEVKGKGIARTEKSPTPPIPKDKRTVTIREVATFPSLTKITRFRREWEDDEEVKGKGIARTEKSPTPPIPKDKRTVTIREVPTFPSLTKITRFRREWEDDEEALLGPRNLPRRGAAPCGSRNKKKWLGDSFDSMAPGLVMDESLK